MILHFISSTSRFLNSFVSTASARLDDISHKIGDAERQLTLLEEKLASIPGLSLDDHDEEEEDKQEKQGARQGETQVSKNNVHDSFEIDTNAEKDEKKQPFPNTSKS